MATKEEMNAVPAFSVYTADAYLEWAGAVAGLLADATDPDENDLTTHAGTLIAELIRAARQAEERA